MSCFGSASDVECLRDVWWSHMGRQTLLCSGAMALIWAGVALPQVPRGPSTVLECAQLPEGFGLGHDDEKQRRGWLETIVDPVCNYFKFGYPGGMTWGAMFITAGPVVDKDRQRFDYSGYEYVSVEMRGERGGELVDIGFKTHLDPNDGSEPKDHIVGIDQSWRWYTFALSRFSPRKANETLEGRLSNLYVVTELVADGQQPRTVYLRRVRFGPARPTLRSAQNAASNLPNLPIAPGSLLSVFGSDLGPPNGASCGPDLTGNVPSVCGETRVFFDDAQAPVLFANSNQINVQVPYALSNRAKTTLRVQATQQSIAAQMELPVAAAAPGLFTEPAGTQVIGLNWRDATVNSINSPVRRGDELIIYATGSGQTSPASSTGVVCREATPSSLPITVTIDGKNAKILYAGCAPGTLGVTQVNLVVPDDAQIGFVPIVLNAGEYRSQAGVRVAVR